VLTNLTFDYTGAQLKAGSNGKSYFDVVDVIGATGRKDDVGLVVNANGYGLDGVGIRSKGGRTDGGKNSQSQNGLLHLNPQKIGSSRKSVERGLDF